MTALTLKPDPRDLALWYCAAALDPDRPSEAGVCLGYVLAGKPTYGQPFKVEVSDVFTSFFRTPDERATIGLVFEALTTRHAKSVLGLHGLELYEAGRGRFGPEDIPF